MEKEIDIAKILKNATIGTKLYSPLFGDVFLKYIGEMFITVRHHGTTANFYHNGRLYDYEGTELMLFPSREMRDWSKFNWKKGDVLVSNDGGTEVIFDKWYDDTYTNFYSKHYLNSEDENNIKYNEAFLCTTERYSLENKDAAQTYINTIEEKLGGKLNRETLEIEKTQTEFKNGDIVVTDAVPSLCYSKCIFILKGDLNTGESCANSYIFYNIDNNVFCFDVLDTEIRYRNIRLATEEEKKQLFSALAKEGKRWDSKKKRIVDLKPKVEFKPFDKVLIRNYYNEVWKCDFYSFGIGAVHSCIVNGNCKQCIPYNEETAKLIGTTKDIKG